MMNSDHLRSEHGRLLTRYESIIDSSFKDFLLLAALASIPAIIPISKALGGGNSVVEGKFMLSGFLMAIAIITILSLRDLLKWCIAEPYLRRMIEIENLLENESDDPASQGVGIATRIFQIRQRVYIPQLRMFGGFGAVVLITPIFVLNYHKYELGMIIYFIAMTICFVYYIVASQSLKKKLIDNFPV